MIVQNKLGLLTLSNPICFLYQKYHLKLEHKILNGFERLAEALKSLLWLQAKKHKLSPIQIQIILFVQGHDDSICNVSHLAREFNITKATVSDAVRVLIKKELLEKDFSPTDNRRFNLLLTDTGIKVAEDLLQYADPLASSLSSFTPQEMASTYKVITHLIYDMNQKGIIQVQRTCFNCRFYEGDKSVQHHCTLLGQPLSTEEIRLDCPEFENAL